MSDWVPEREEAQHDGTANKAQDCGYPPGRLPRNTLVPQILHCCHFGSSFGILEPSPKDGPSALLSSKPLDATIPSPPANRGGVSPSCFTLTFEDPDPFIPYSLDR